MNALHKTEPFNDPHIEFDGNALRNKYSNEPEPNGTSFIPTTRESSFFLNKNIEPPEQMSTSCGEMAAWEMLDLQPPTVRKITHFIQSDSFIEIKKWEGVVTHIDTSKELFWVHLKDQNILDVTDETFFSFDDIDSDDKKLVVEGAIFYWSIGYQRTESGGRHKVSIIKFRRLPAWRLSESKKVANRFEELKKILL